MDYVSKKKFKKKTFPRKKKKKKNETQQQKQVGKLQKKKTYRKKNTVDSKIKKALEKEKSKEIHMFCEQIISPVVAIQYNSGDGYVYASSQLESLAVGTTPQTRIGNRIDLLGIRINYKFQYTGVREEDTYQDLVDNLTSSFKIVVLQLKEIKGDNSLYAWPNVKADYNNLGQVFGNQDLCMDFGNNQGNRKRWNIVWEKRFTLQQAQESVVYPPTGSPTVKQQAPMYPSMIKGTKWIPAKKLMPVEYNPYSYEATTGTKTGGIVTCVISNRTNSAIVTGKRLQRLEQEEKAEAIYIADLEKQVMEKVQNN